MTFWHTGSEQQLQHVGRGHFLFRRPWPLSFCCHSILQNPLSKPVQRPVQTAVQTPSRPRPDTLIFCPDHSEALLEMVKTQYKTATPTITASDQVVPFIKLKGNISYSWPPQPPADARHPRRPSLALRRMTRVVGQEFWNFMPGGCSRIL